MSESDQPMLQQIDLDPTVPVSAGCLQPSQGEPSDGTRFCDLPLAESVQQAVRTVGYETPTPIQSRIIPYMLEGRDVLAQSQTGTGKTAAFALPILSRLDVEKRSPQVLVLTPTRELTLQVANSFEKYGEGFDQLRVATIYGGQSYDPQLRQLQRGAQVIVGTPGRVIDHIQRGTLDITSIDCLVLDEADEMLNRGFLEDVQFVLNETPATRQIALFSATLPQAVQSIAEQHLNDPARITIKKRTSTAENIRQQAVLAAPRDKVFALCRILESETTDGVIVFTKTKATTLTLAEKLCQRGWNAVALNGDMPQATRERTIEQFKSGRLDVLVATDVAARGLDVSRVSHVINFDPPHDPESYVHRVGRTGRAGRSGKAFLLLSPSQRGKLRLIERATNQQIEIVPVPTTELINQLRINRFKQQISELIDSEELTVLRDLIVSYAAESGKPLELIAAALAHLGQQGRPFLETDRPKSERRTRSAGTESDARGEDRPNRRRSRRDSENVDQGRTRSETHRKFRKGGQPEAGMTRYRVEVGRRDGVKPGNLVGAVANEAGIDGEFIGPIVIHDDHSLIDLPEGMPSDIYHSLRRTRVVGKPLQLSVAKDKRGEKAGKRGRVSDRRRFGVQGESQPLEERKGKRSSSQTKRAPSKARNSKKNKRKARIVQ